MSFYSKLKTRLENKVPEKVLKDLPRGYFLLGKILVLRLKPSLRKYKKTIGEETIHLIPYAHTVILEKGISGIYRKPKVEVIAGCRCHPEAQTLLKEHGRQFLIDISKVMWSKGNKEERQRIVKLAKAGETVVDMFAGIGYFSVFLARKVERVYSIEINRDASEVLRKNVWLNNVESKVEILEGDCRKFSNLLEKTADRIVMGYLHDTEKFLPYALKIAKSGATMHMHRAVAEKGKAKFYNIFKKQKLKLLREVKVKSYAPGVWHMVFDLQKRGL